jgi:hypothetical protein
MNNIIIALKVGLLNFGSQVLWYHFKAMELQVIKLQIRLIVIASLLLVICLSGGCAPMQGLDARFDSIVRPYRFNLIGWECRALSNELNQWIFGSSEEIDGEVDVVIEYFSTIERLKNLESEIKAVKAGSGQSGLALLEDELNMLQEQVGALGSKVEGLIEKQIRETLAEQGIFHPMDKYIRLKFGFPPVNFILEKPPHLLVISPRDRIESIREITFRQDISLEEIEDIEAAVDDLGVASLVVELGGIATYPTFVTNDASLKFTLDTATEEWLHQYLAFKPLGFLYLLDLTGVSQNYDIATMNETVAGMVSKEIGAMIREKYYPQFDNDDSQPPGAESEFDFNREMREIRRVIDSYLAQGEIELTEEFMEQKRLYLASNGYYIRKLNQAYFAFHGTYADRPTSISPIGLELRQLRSQSASLKVFLDTVAGMTSRQELRDSIK